MIAAGGERISQAGAKLGSLFIYASQSYLVAWGAHGTEQTWDLKHSVTCVASNGEKLYAGTQAGSVYSLTPDGTLELVKEVTKSITCLFVGSRVFFGSSDGQVYELGTELAIRPNERFYPMCIAYNDQYNIMAVGGTSTSIFLLHLTPDFDSKNRASWVELPGHENWVKSLDFCVDSDALVLASGSQDKYVRLWRISSAQQTTDLLKSTLNTTVYKVTDKLNCVFDALLIGHDDWVTSVKWQPCAEPQLLSASGDSSLIVWSSSEAQETDDESMWTPTHRLGDVSIMGASTATGATGGFWTAEWLDASTVATLGRTGSWRVWKYETGAGAEAGEWRSAPAVTGHTKPVSGVAWFGESVVSVSHDQTTRLWARLNDPPLNEYYELNRPQIHGYDMNCVAAVGSQLVTGGDEKILRCFSAPQVYHDLISNFTSEEVAHSQLAAASVPALGLSNKATETSEAFDASALPLEQQLQRLTLWPETDKIFGHGYELVCVDVSLDGRYVASCCRANSVRNAVVRVYDTEKFHQVAVLSGEHTLTVNRIKFSPDSRHLLSVGRDRQWAVYDVEKMEMVARQEKAHSRIIWDGCWLSPGKFCTVSRDKSVKVWALGEGEAVVVASRTFDDAVTACAAGADGIIFIGLEGAVHEVELTLEGALEQKRSWAIEGRPNQLAVKGDKLAVACDTLRIFNL